ncbi:MAG: GtrA family protein [Actinomycetota bacterium]
MIRRLLARESTTQIVRLAVIGILNTVNYFILLNLLRSAGVGLFVSVTIAFGVATFVSYVLNRRWTFGLDESSGGAAETLRFYLVNVAAWAATVAVIWIADQLFGPLDRLGENLASVAAAGITLLPKFLSYRDLVFGKALQAARGAVGA